MTEEYADNEDDRMMIIKCIVLRSTEEQDTYEIDKTNLLTASVEIVTKWKITLHFTFITYADFLAFNAVRSWDYVCVCISLIGFYGWLMLITT